MVATHLSVSKEAVALRGSGHELGGKVFFLSSYLVQIKLTFLITVPPGTLSERRPIYDKENRASTYMSWNAHVSPATVPSLSVGRLLAGSNAGYMIYGPPCSKTRKQLSLKEWKYKAFPFLPCFFPLNESCYVWFGIALHLNKEKIKFYIICMNLTISIVPISFNCKFMSI